MSKDLSKVPVFILAGGLGTRLSEETHLLPKPMIEIGGIPMIVHIMRWYYSFGFNDFVICAGYKSWEIKQYFLTYSYRRNHFSIDNRGENSSGASVYKLMSDYEKWRVRVIDTGLETMTGGRVARALDMVLDEERPEHFALTYGDGLCDIDLRSEFDFHLEHGKTGTIMGVSPPSRFGEMSFDSSNIVTGFTEKPPNAGGGINGGYFFFKKDFREYLSTESELILERAPLEKLAADRELALYKHSGFWQCMDTLRDKKYLMELWDSGKAPWRREYD